jgi:putative hydrolase of HD superfamily
MRYIMSDASTSTILNYLYEMGHLKRSRRTGWWLAGIKDAETIAEHTFRVAVIGYVLALLEGADPALTTLLCLFHDTPESRTSDIPSVGRAYLRASPDTQVAGDQLADVPPVIGQAIYRLIAQYEARDSRESELAHDADKLDCLLQAREYQAQGNVDVEAWITSSAAAVKSASARQLAQLAQEIPPQQWWRTFVDSHHLRHRAAAPASDGLRLQSAASG